MNLSNNIFVCGISRSGTTLLTTILDSHPDVSMGYELLPMGLPSLSNMIKILEQQFESGHNNANDVQSSLEDMGYSSFSTFIKRCARSSISPLELFTALKEEENNKLFNTPSKTIQFRALISQLVVEKKCSKEGTLYKGFKLNCSSFNEFNKLFPNSKYIYILRDPRDVVSSQTNRGFERSLSEIIEAWKVYLEKFIAFSHQNSEKCLLVKYEDLVSNPDSHLNNLLSFCNLSYTQNVREFFNSKASVHKTRHINTSELAQDFFTSSIGRWKQDLPSFQVKIIEETLGAILINFGYQQTSLDIQKLGSSLLNEKRKGFLCKRKFQVDQYRELLDLYTPNLINLTLQETTTSSKYKDKDILLIRHDIDHDIENAVKLAEWESSYGVRSTYCVLHTAWYYGTLINGTYTHYDLMLDSCKKIQSLGHEINFHNNLGVLALRENSIDPFQILKDELEYFQKHGIKITGTSTHGDALCRELNFRNYEIFSESVYESRGGARIVKWQDNEVALASRSMEEFGLEYEGYDLPRDIYITDSGGNLRTLHDTRGRAGKRREEMDQDVQFGKIIAILTHPIWWNI